MAAVSREHATKLLKEMVDFFEAEIPPEQTAVLLRGIEHGHLEFDAEKEEFRVHLRKPVELKNGEKITVISMPEPEVEQMKTAGKAGDEFAQTSRLISLISGIPEEVIGRIRMRDMTLAGVVISFFG
jgi:hypothetical protein